MIKRLLSLALVFAMVLAFSVPTVAMTAGGPYSVAGPNEISSTDYLGQTEDANDIKDPVGHGVTFSTTNLPASTVSVNFRNTDKGTLTVWFATGKKTAKECEADKKALKALQAAEKAALFEAFKAEFNGINNDFISDLKASFTDKDFSGYTKALTTLESAVKKANDTYVKAMFDAQQAEEKAEDAAEAAYDKSVEAAEKAFSKAIASAEKNRDSAVKNAKTTFDKAVKNAKDVVNSKKVVTKTKAEVIADANTAYDNAVKKANDAYEKALLKALDDYDKAIAKAEAALTTALAKVGPNRETAEKKASDAYSKALESAKKAFNTALAKAPDKVKEAVSKKCDDHDKKVTKCEKDKKEKDKEHKAKCEKEKKECDKNKKECKDSSKYYKVVFELPNGHVGAFDLVKNLKLGEGKKIVDLKWTWQDSEVETDATLSFEKKVDGKNIVEWLLDSKYANYALDIIDGLEFYLTGVDNDNAYMGSVNTEGKVVFANVEPGKYILSEEVTGAAVGIFTAIDPITIEIFAGDDKFVVLSGASSGWGFSGSGLNSDFDKGAEYIAGSRTDTGPTLTGGVNGNDIPNVQDYFVTALTGPTKGSEYLSFCGSGDASSLGDVYVDMTAKFVEEFSEDVKANLINAYDFILAEFGSLDVWTKNGNWFIYSDEDFYAGNWDVPTKLIGQIVTWKLMADVLGLDADNLALIGSANPDVINAINAKATEVYDAVIGGYVNQGKVNDLVFLADKDYSHDVYLSYKNCQPQIVPLGGGKFYVNNETVVEKDASLSFEKKVDGKNIVEWLLDSKYADYALDIIDGLEFYLTGVDNSNVYMASVNTEGKVVFANVEPGKYILSEEVTGAAVGIFTPIDPITIEIFEGDNKFIVLSGVSSDWGFSGGGLNGDFDKTATYNAGVVAGSYDLTVDGAYVTDRDGTVGTNYWVSNYFVTAINGPTEGAEYLSFCSSAASHALGVDSYVDKTAKLVEEFGEDVKAQLVDAFDYIVAEFGSLNVWLENGRWGTFNNDDFDDGIFTIPTKFIGQIVDWKILATGLGLDADNIKAACPDAYQPVYNKINELADEVYDAVMSGGYKSQGFVTDLVFLANENYSHFDYESYVSCQPQIVPMGPDGFYINNETEVEKDASLSFEKRVDGMNIVEWLLDSKYADYALDIIDGLEFYLTGVDNNNAYMASVNTEGKVVFANVEPGKYILSEEVTGAAVGIFTPIDPITIEISEGDNKFIVLSGASTAWGFGGGLNTGFDPDITYWFDIDAYNAALKIEKFDGFGDFHVTDGVDSYTSFCAMFDIGTGSDPLKTAEGFEANKEDVVKAFNYIFDNWGSIDQWPKFAGSDWYSNYRYSDIDGVPGPELATKAIAQLVLWTLVDSTQDWTMGPYGSDRVIAASIDAAVAQTLANFKTATVGNNITDIFFLAYIDDSGRITGSQPQIVPISGEFYVENETVVEKDGSLSFEKKVEGENIIDWLLDSKYADYALDIIAGLEFYLTGVDNNNAYMASVNTEGRVVFANVEPGKYILSEEVTGAAVGVFKAMDDIEIVIGEGENKFFTLGGSIKGGVEGVDVKADDRFSLHNGYGEFWWGYDASGIGYPGLNATGHIFNITVTNIRTGQTFYSFCANGGSENFGGGDYLIAHSMTEIDWIQAFNYINDTYGDLNDNRVITQVITWVLLGAVDAYDLDQTKLKADEKAAIIDVWENYAGYVGEGKVVDVWFMEYENTPENKDYTQCQPQIVPVFGEFYVENELEVGKDASFSFAKLVGEESIIDWILDNGYSIDILDGLVFTLTNVDDDSITYTESVNTEGMVVFAKIEPGKYILTESITGAALEVFVENTDEDEYDIDPGEDLTGADFVNIPKERFGSIKVGARISALEEFIVQTHKDQYIERRYNNSYTTQLGRNVATLDNTDSTLVTLDSDDLAYLRSGGVLTFGIAQRNKANTPLGCYYNVSIVGNNLVITADDIVSLNVLARAFRNKITDFGNNGGSGTIGPNGSFIVHNGMNRDPFILAATDNVLYLYFHGSDVRYYELDGQGNRVTFCVVDTVSAVQTRASDANLSLTYSIDGGTTFTDGTFADLAAGPYTVALYVDGVYYDEVELVVVPGEEATHTFTGPFIVNAGNPVKIVNCAKCDVWL